MATKFNIKGIQLQLLIGETSPSPAPEDLTVALEDVEVTHSDEGRSGFQINFQAGRSGKTDQGYELVDNNLLQVFNRVILVVTIDTTATVLMDGIITHQQLKPGKMPQGAFFTVTGEDVSVMMDLEEKLVAYPSMDEPTIAEQLVGQYSQYGLEPKITTPEGVQAPDPNEYVPIQRGTDLAYLNEMASRFAFIFYVSPGESPGTNTAYWGPPIVQTSPQPALSVDMGTATNVQSVNLQYDALAPTTVFGWYQDRQTDEVQSIEIKTNSDLWPALSANPALTSQPKVRKSLLNLGDRWPPNEAQSMAQAIVDRSTNKVVVVEGKMDSLRYGSVLQTRGLVGLRGVTPNFDGNYYVKKVTHRLRQFSYTQDFTITREGLGAKSSTVAV